MTAATVDKKISVRLDETSEPQNSCWIVSLDDYHGTSTLSIHETRRQAVKDAMWRSGMLKVPCVECDQHGVETLLS